MSGIKNLVLVPVLSLALAAAPAVYALDQEQVGRQPTTDEVLADGLIARPLSLIGTVIGAAAFVVMLPFTLPSKSVTRAADTLVAQPARDTFRKPIGQFDSCTVLPESCK